jgi:hypothetical protein
LNLTAEQLRTIAAALDELTEITKLREVSFTPSGFLEIGLADNTLSVTRDSETGAYVIDDRNGD